MPQYKSIIVNVSGKIPEHYSEAEPAKLMAALNDGWQIKEVHQIAARPGSGGQGSSIVGVVIITYILIKP